MHLACFILRRKSSESVRNLFGVYDPGNVVQFEEHEGPRRLLLGTAASPYGLLALVEASPHDNFWGRGIDGEYRVSTAVLIVSRGRFSSICLPVSPGSGANHLGCLLMRLRAELLEQHPQPPAAASSAASTPGSGVPRPPPAPLTSVNPAAQKGAHSMGNVLSGAGLDRRSGVKA